MFGGGGGNNQWGSAPQQSQGGMFGSPNTGMGNMGMLGSLLGMGAAGAGQQSAAASNSASGGGGLLSSLFGGGSQQQSAAPPAPWGASQQQTPATGQWGASPQAPQGMWGAPPQQATPQYGAAPQQMGAPAYGQQPQQQYAGAADANSKGVLITGCQAHETSADACPSGDPSKAFGALTNALVTSVRAVKRQNPNATPTYEQLVQDVRSVLLKTRYKQV